MKAMLIQKIQEIKEGNNPLTAANVEIPVPGHKQILIKVHTCGVCHTELDEIEGRTPPAKLPLIPGHQVVGVIENNGNGSSKFNTGERVGVAWIFSSCGNCKFCRDGEENLCDEFRATGRDDNGGYSEYMVANEDFAYGIPSNISDTDMAPMLCAGAIGYRSLTLCNIQDGEPVGLMGFGASAHLVIKLIKNIYPSSKLYAFARSEQQRNFANELGAEWSGDINEYSPVKLSAIIDTTPVWKPVVESLKNLDKGGRLVINAIRKENSDIEYLKNIKYEKHLWNEKEIKSVANVTRKDIENMIFYVSKFNLKPEVSEYPLKNANEALLDLKQGSSRGAKVLRIND